MATSSAASSLFSVVGKKVLVTGGSRGIGLMIAKGFVDHGAHVMITSRDEKACAEASRNLGDRCHYTTSNLGSREGCDALYQTVHEVFGGQLDVLINNAGASWGEDPCYDNTKESGKRTNWGWDKVLDLNVKGIFYLTRKCVPMLQHNNNNNNNNNDPGRVINIGSVAGLVPQEAPTHAYDVSKAAVHHLSKKMARDLAPLGVTVNVVAPGFVPSRMSDGLQKYTDLTDADVIQKVIPMGRMGNDDDMAGACIYLASKAGAWVTGTVLPVDGGTVGALQIPLSSL
jgi:NAD(P)-dependent dehydrogenase (short-subunit alcohol dehydrogenase family)